MTAKLRLELENATKKGFDEIVKDLERMGVEGKDTEKALEQLNKELQSRAATETAKQMKHLADEMDGTTAKTKKAADELEELNRIAKNAARDGIDSTRDSLRRLGLDANKSDTAISALNQELANRQARKAAEDVKRLADELDGTAKSARKAEYAIQLANKAAAAANSQSQGGGDGLKWTEVWSKVQLGKQALAGVVWGARLTAQAVDALAERGSPSAKKLQTSFEQLQEVVVNLADDPSIQNWMDDLSFAINHGLIPSLREGESSFSDFVKISNMFAHDMTIVAAQIQEDLGQIPAGTTKALTAAMRGLEAARRGQEAATKKANEDRRAQREKEREEQKAEREQDLVNPGTKMRADQDRVDRIEKMQGAQGEIQVQQALNELLAKQAALVAELKAKTLDPTTNRQVLDNAKELTALETKRAQLIKERQDKQKAKDKELADAKATSDKKNFDEELKHIDTLLRESVQSAREIDELEKRRFALVKENKDRERKLLIEKGQLEQSLLQEDLARIELRKRKEYDAIQAGIDGERKLFLAREHRRDLERQAEQEKVDKFKEFLSGGGSGGGGGVNASGIFGNTSQTFAPSITISGGAGGGHDCCCCPPGGGASGGMGSGGSMPMGGMGGSGVTGAGWYPGGGPGGKMPMPVGWAGQGAWPGGGPSPRPDPIGLLTGGITPRQVRDRVLKNAQDDAEKKRIEDGQANGTLDQNGKPIDQKAEEARQAGAKSRQFLKDQAKRFGINLPGGDVQQSFGDDRKSRSGWNDVTPGGITKHEFFDGPREVVDDSEDGQEIFREDKAAQDARRKARESARAEEAADPYKKITALHKQQEEQQRKQKAAEETLKQGQVDKAANLPELEKAKADADAKMAEIQKQKDEELKRVKAFEEQRRKASSEASKAAKAKSDADFKEHRGQQEGRNEVGRAQQKFEDEARQRHIDQGGDGSVGLTAEGKLVDLQQTRVRDEAAKKRREKEQRFSPDYGPETPKDRAEARRKAEARAKGASRISRTKVKQGVQKRAKRGEIRGPETTRAYHDLVKEQVGQLKAQGKLDQTEITAIEQLLDAVREKSQGIAEMQEKLDQLIDAIAELRGLKPPKARRQAGL